METTDDLGLSRSKSDLKAIRDKKIIELAPEYSIEDLSFLYKLKAQSIAAFLKKNNVEPISVILSESDRLDRDNELKSIRQSLCEELEKQGLTNNDILYIHQRSLVTRRKNTDKDDIKYLKSKLEESEKLIASYNSYGIKREKDIDSWKLKTINLETKVISLEKELESEKQNNNKVRLSLQNKLSHKEDEIADLRENLLSVKESNKNLSVKYAETELLLNSQNQRATSAELVNADLQKRIIELESSLSQQIEANLKLQSENKELKKEVAMLEADFDKLAFSDDIKTEKIDSKFKKVFDREQIKSVYIENDFCLKSTYESLQNQFVYISYRHLQNILKEEGIYKHTYKVKKKRQK